MVILFFKERIAVYLSAIRKLISVLTLTLISQAACAQSSLYQSIVNPQSAWHSYMFVSLQMPTSSLIAIAKEAQQKQVTLVISGFEGEGVNIKYTEERIALINDACCHNKSVSWMIHPVLFRDYKIDTVPTLVIAKDGEPTPDNFTKVTGDIGLMNSLKLIYQKSKNQDFRDQAKKIYENSLQKN